MKKVNMNELFTPVIVTKYIFFGAMALFGGIVHALIAKRNNVAKTWSDVAVLSVISGFAGIMWTLLALAYYPNNIYLVGFSAGMGGFASTEGLIMLLTVIRDKLSK